MKTPVIPITWKKDPRDNAVYPTADVRFRMIINKHRDKTRYPDEEYSLCVCKGTPRTHFYMHCKYGRTFSQDAFAFHILSFVIPPIQSVEMHVTIPYEDIDRFPGTTGICPLYPESYVHEFLPT